MSCANKLRGAGWHPAAAWQAASVFLKPRSTGFSLCLIFFFSTALSAQDSALQNPPWLAPVPDATPTATLLSPTSNENSYSTPAPIADVIAHYERQLKGAGLEFQSNYDGLGTTIRIQIPKRAALVQIRESDSGVSFKTIFVVDVPVPFHSLSSGWPDWLNPITGAQFREYGVPHVDATTHRRYLDGYYSAPYTFDQTTGYYKSLLASHGYQVASQLLTSAEISETERVGFLEGRLSDERIRIFVLGSLPAVVAIEIW